MLMLKDIYFDRIESYLEGTNSPDDKKQFEQDLADNPELKAEYQAYLATRAAVQDFALEEIRIKVAQIAQTPPRSAKILQLNRRTIAIAAGFLILIAALSFLFGRQQYSNQNLFVQQYESPNWSPIRGANSTAEKYDQALAAVQAGKVEQAIQQLRDIKQGDELFATAQYTLGHLLLQTDQTNGAMASLEEVRDLNDTRYQENVEWILTLAYLRAGKESLVKQQLGTILQNEQHPYREDALRLQSRLQSFWRRF